MLPEGLHQQGKLVSAAGTNPASRLRRHGPWPPARRLLAGRAAWCGVALVAAGTRARPKPLPGVERERQEQTDAFLLVYFF